MKRTMTINFKVGRMALTVAAAWWIVTGACAHACSPSPAKRAGLQDGIAANLVAAGRPGRVHLPPASKANDLGAPTVVGMWHVVYTTDGQAVGEGFDTYSADGTETLVDNENPATDNVCTGVWVQTGPLTYKLTHPSWNFDTNGNLIGTVIIRDSVTLGKDGNSYTASETIDLFDNSGTPTGHFEFSLAATRIKPI